MRKAEMMGFAVAKPWAEGEGYDSIVRFNNLMLRVQVKSVLTKSPTRTYYRLSTCSTNPRSKVRKPYTSDQIEFLAGYIFSEDIWYIFPSTFIQGKKSVCLTPGCKRSRFEPYREAWHLMRPAPVEVVPEQGMAAVAST